MVTVISEVRLSDYAKIFITEYLLPYYIKNSLCQRKSELMIYWVYTVFLENEIILYNHYIT